MPDIPTDLRYSKDHLWARPGPAARMARIGVTDFAQQSLGDVVDVTLPRPGDMVTAGEACGDIESTKSVSDLIAPVTGTVRTRMPEPINTDPYGQAGCSRPADRNRVRPWHADHVPPCSGEREVSTVPATQPNQALLSDTGLAEPGRSTCSAHLHRLAY